MFHILILFLSISKNWPLDAKRIAFRYVWVLHVGLRCASWCLLCVVVLPSKDLLVHKTAHTARLRICTHLGWILPSETTISVRSTCRIRQKPHGWVKAVCLKMRCSQIKHDSNPVRSPTAVKLSICLCVCFPVFSRLLPWSRFMAASPDWVVVSRDPFEHGPRWFFQREGGMIEWWWNDVSNHVTCWFLLGSQDVNHLPCLLWQEMSPALFLNTFIGFLSSGLLYAYVLEGYVWAGQPHHRTIFRAISSSIRC